MKPVHKVKTLEKGLAVGVATALMAGSLCIGSLAVRERTVPTLTLTASASAETAETIMADALKELTLFQGRDDGYALDAELTRAQAITMLIRCIGAEKAALSGTDYKTPFLDVPDWAKPYVGYAYENGITKGAGEDIFLPDDLIPMNQFLTLLLRALGYSEGTGDFTWQEPYELAEKLGIKDSAQSAESFDRGDMVKICFRLLSAVYVDTGHTVASTLISQGVFDRAVYNSSMAKAEERLRSLDGSDDTTVTEPETSLPPETTKPEATTPPTTTEPAPKPPVTTNDGWTGLY